MSEKNHFAALQEIRNWNTHDVIYALKNNGLDECVDACKKRDITGERLLELSEMKLGLWKCDLTIVNIRKLATFVQDISKMPSKYTTCSVSSNSEDAWDTDFDDDDDIEEDSSQKTEINIPNESNFGKKIGPNGAAYASNGFSNTQKFVEKNSSTQRDNKSPPVHRNSFSQVINKLNIPSAFTSGYSSQNGSLTNLSSGSVSKSPFLKAKDGSERIKKEESPPSNNVKPNIPSRPPSLYTKSSPQENTHSSLPKPPAFDNEGLVFREICDKIFEHDIMDEYESIDEDMLHGRSVKSSKSNGVGGSPCSSQQNLTESPQKSPKSNRSANDVNQKQVSPMSSLHRNQFYNIQKNNTSTQQTSKMDFNSVIKSLKKSPVLSGGSARKQEGTVQSLKSVFSDKQEKVESPQRSPVPLPVRNEAKQESPNASSLHLNLLANFNRINEPSFTVGSTMTSKTKAYDECIPREMKQENGMNEHISCEEVYECIPEHVSTHCGRVESCEYSEGYLVPNPPPSLPPKPNQLLNNVKSTKTESNGTSSSLWSFGPQKHKSLHPEKTSPDGKITNTLPMPRSMNSYVSETPRPSASRPLPPPPVDGGVQRVIKIPLVQMPWYFNVDRARGEEILRNSEDGTFMIRPSTKTQNALTLTLKYGKRPFNICVRHRPDGKFALGSAKPTEQTFSSVEELVNHYTSNELLLYSNGKQAGIVVLTSPPRKD